MPPAPCTSGSTRMPASVSACSSRNAVEPRNGVSVVAAGPGWRARRAGRGRERACPPQDRTPPSWRKCRHDSRRVKARKRRRVRTPRFSQYCAAIFIATSTATEPLSAKNTWFRLPGSSAASRAAKLFRRLVGEAAEHHMRHARELRLDGVRDMRVVVAVARGPPGRDAVDQLSAVFQRDSAAVCAGGFQRGCGALHLGVRAPEVVQGSKQFFFEKKNQKAFVSAVAPCGRPRDSRDKSFLLLFFKKEGLAYLLADIPSRSSNARSRSAAGLAVVSSRGP